MTYFFLIGMFVKSGSDSYGIIEHYNFQEQFDKLSTNLLKSNWYVSLCHAAKRVN
jgi:hypothetical protein